MRKPDPLGCELAESCLCDSAEHRPIPSIPPSRWPLFRHLSLLRSGRSDPLLSTEPSPCRYGHTAPSGSGSVLRPGYKSFLWLNWSQRHRPIPV